ncbi:hypothetical protein MPER_00550, partial [Moniliophthora perniciosa FA553]
GKNLHIGYPTKKLSPKREGPFEIIEALGPVNYRLELPEQWKIHNVFHANLLTPFKENEVHGPNYSEPPPDLINDEEEYEIEAIVAHKPKKNPKKFLVSWVGYPPSHNEWKTKKEFDRAQDILKEYKKAHKLRAIFIRHLSNVFHR